MTFVALWGQSRPANPDGTELPRGLSPKPSVRDYEKFVDGPSLSLAANYMGRSFEAELPAPLGTTQRRLFDAGRYLVLEVALFPVSGHEPSVSIGNFRLVLDGKKIPFSTQTPGSVAAYLRYPTWDATRPRLEMGGGVGNAGVVLGRPQPVPRFPDDPRPRQTQLPMPPQVTTETIDAPRAAVESSFLEGPLQGPRAGNLYFDVPGKLSKVKSILLVYENHEIRRELKLR